LPIIGRWAGDPGITTSQSSCWRCCSSSNTGLELLTPRDIVEMLKETLPRRPEGKDALATRIVERHATTSRHRFPLPNATKASGGLGEATAGRCDSVKLE